MIRKHKKFDRPRQAFDSERIKAEDLLVEKYGLKNKKELWKVKAQLDTIRRQAKKLIDGSEEDQTVFINKLKGEGFNSENPVDVLALTEEDILNRRLQTVIVKKSIATTLKGARQLITHKHVLVDGRIVNIPSYKVSVNEESRIKKVGMKKKVMKKEEPKIAPAPAPDQVGLKEGVPKDMGKEEPKMALSEGKDKE